VTSPYFFEPLLWAVGFGSLALVTAAGGLAVFDDLEVVGDTEPEVF
jgi:hypothetical protein